MDYKALYQSKLTTPEEAVKCVHDGDWVAWGWVSNTPKACDHAMAEHLKTLHDVQFRGGILMWKPEMFDMENAKDHFTWNSWHMSGVERKMIDRGFCFYAPVRYSEVPKYCRETPYPDRVFFAQCAPMDEHGYFNFGPNASHLIEICNRAEEIIIEVVVKIILEIVQIIRSEEAICRICDSWVAITPASISLRSPRSWKATILPWHSSPPAANPLRTNWQWPTWSCP